MPPTLKVQLLVILLLLGQPWLSEAQTEFLRFKQLNLEQGLSHNRVTCALQDREGFMWFGTQYGLNKYDGYTFTVFRSDPNDRENTLQHNFIKSIQEDRAGRLWVITQGGGLHQVDKHTGKIIPYAIPLLRNSSWNVIFSLYEDQAGIFWMGTQRGILRFNPRTRQFAQYKTPLPVHVVIADAAGRFWAISDKKLHWFDIRTGRLVPQSLSFSTGTPPTLSSIYPGEQGILWLGSANHGLFRLNTNSRPLQLESYNPGKLLHNHINAKGIYRDRRGHIWLATTEGLQRLDEKSGQVITYQASLVQPGALNSNDVQFIYEDRLGTIWVGTYNGINKADTQAKPFRTGQVTPSSSIRLAENAVRTILEDSSGTIWLGAWRKGLHYLPPSGKQFSHIPANPTYSLGLSSVDVGGLYEDRAGRLWIGTTEGLHLLDRATGRFTRYPAEIPVQFIHEDQNGKLWISGRRMDSQAIQTIASFDPATKQFCYYRPENDSGRPYRYNPFDIMVSRTGDVWVGTLGGGINRLNPQTGQFTFYLPDSSFSAGHLNDIDIRTLYEDEQGIIWVGTSQGGLNRFDPRIGTFTYFTAREGLPSNRVESIIGDASGNLWLGTNQGISRFNPRTKTFRNYDVADGLPDNQFVENCVSRRKDQLLFGTMNGFVAFNPADIQDNKVVPPVYITDLKVLEKSRPVTAGPVELPYNQNFLSFDFVALNYNSPEKNQYAYQLVGLDQDWVYAGTRRYASYPGLVPGKYTFRVKASNNDGIWNEKGASLTIIIKPAYWHTWWFVSGAVTAFAVLALLLMKRREKNIRVREAQKTELEKLKAISYQHQLEIEQVNKFFTASMPEQKSPADILDDVARNCIAKLGFEDGAIYLLDNERKLLVQKAVWQPKTSSQPGSIYPVTISWGEGLIGAVAATGKARHSAGNQFAVGNILNGAACRAVMAVPMINNGQVMGVIITTYPQKEFFAEHYLQLLTTIASQCTDRINKTTAEQEVRKKETELVTLNRNLAASRLKTLQSQMNPHFIFNSLNSIQYFIATNDKQAAMSYLAKFARLVRQILDSSVSGRVTLSNELEMLTNYIALEQLRLENSFDFTIRVDEKTIPDNLAIPAMLLQPYVENAVLHGLRYLSGRRGRLLIQICKIDEGLICVIEDNGIGREKSGRLKPATHQSTATELSRRCLTDLNGTTLYQGGRVNTIDLYDDTGHAAGTRVEIRVPVFVNQLAPDDLVC